MRSALIGASGFVGSNLERQRKFDRTFGSKNISEIEAQSFDLVVIAAPSAVKWWANANPEQDLAHVQALIEPLRKVEAKTVVLYSTVDVYPSPIGVDENSPIDNEACQPYGKHRLMLERVVREHFDTRIIRLPGLFGHGLKKNVIFDFLNDNEIQKIDTRHVFQFYPLRLIGTDLETVLSSDIRLLNVSVEPIETGAVARICLGRDYHNEVAPKPIRYDFRSVHAPAFGGSDGYLYDRATVEAELERFVTEYRGARAA